MVDRLDTLSRWYHTGRRLLYVHGATPGHINSRTLHQRSQGVDQIAAAIGRPGYINLGHGDDMPPSRSVDAMRAHALTVMDEAYALGLRYFDCARSYGHPPAAQRLARAQLKAGEEYARQHL